jgi:hypothetical protein
MASSPDSYPVPSPDSRRNRRASLDPAPSDHFSGADPLAVSLGTAVDLFLAARAAEGASPRHRVASPADRLSRGRST